MLMYKQGRLWTEGASICIPDGFFLETDPDINYERGLSAWNSTQSCLYMWVISENEVGTREGLEEQSCNFKPLSEITPITLNGLSGHWITYSTPREEYYEVRFALPNKVQLILIVEKEGGNIKAVMDSQEFKIALEGIRAEQI